MLLPECIDLVHTGIVVIKISLLCKSLIFVVFVAPEILELPAWKKVLTSKDFSDRLSVVAVDEAHCIAEWSVVSCVCGCILIVLRSYG